MESEKRELILGTENPDYLLAQTNTIVFSGAENDTIDGVAGGGNNRLYGGSGDDEILAGVDDRLFGNKGDDILDATAGGGNNLLSGGKGKDLLMAGKGDRLYGGMGNDQLFGGAGGSVLSGGRGKDEFWLATGDYPDKVITILDFTSGRDVIGISGLTGISGFSDLVLEQKGQNTIIKIAGVKIGILLGIDASTLKPEDFLFPPEENSSHPLDPLTAEEISAAIAIIQEEQNLSEAVLFPSVALKEPDKEEVLAYTPDSPFSREALVVVLEREANKVFEAVVDLNTNTLISWEEIPGVQPGLTDPTEFDLIDEIVKNDPQWQQAMLERGITDFDKVIIDGWAPGMLSETEEESGARLMRGLSFLDTGDGNFYGHPIEGVLVTVNLNTEEVVDFIDTGAVPVNDANAGFSEEAGELLPPLEINQPEGVAFEIKGNEVTWDKWSFRYSLDPRTGLVLHQVAYDERAVLYRGSLSEMAVPYAEVTPTWNFRAAFDVGEYYWGKLANTMELGREVPENGVLLDAVFADDLGVADVWEDVLGIYERDSGLLWYHYNWDTEEVDARSGRELVLTQIVTIGNYDYALDWIFKQDGSIEVEAKLTGILLLEGTEATSVEEVEESKKFATLVGENVLAPNHQHFFNFRLDLDVDGVANSVMEGNVKGLPVSETNPFGNAFYEEETLLTTEKAAMRDMDFQQHREWTVINATEENSLGGEIGYSLEPEGNAVPYGTPDSDVRQRAGFVNHHLWVTQYDESELYAAGDYPNQGEAGQGLPEYVEDDASIVGEDVVLWYTMGVTHVPRPEDYPIMPVETASFKLLPTGFFTSNPTLEI